MAVAAAAVMTDVIVDTVPSLPVVVDSVVLVDGDVDAAVVAEEAEEAEDTVGDDDDNDALLAEVGLLDDDAGSPSIELLVSAQHAHGRDSHLN